METFNVGTILLLCSSFILQSSARITIVTQIEHSSHIMKSHCVTTNESQTLTWTTPYDESYYENCDDKYDDRMIFVPNHWQLESNHHTFTGPILDPRWQIFNTFMTRNMNKESIDLTRPLKIYFEFSFSIKYQDDAEISFSFNRTLLQTLSFKTDALTIYFYKGFIVKKQFILSLDGWNHFTIRYDAQTKQYLMIQNGNIVVVEDTNNFFAIDQVDMQSEEGAIWKLHSYNYYRTIFNLSETMFVEMVRPRDGKLCLSAYFYFEHKLTVELRLDSNIYKQQTFENDKMSWKLIKMEASVNGRTANRFFTFWIKYRHEKDILFSHLKLNSDCESGINKISTDVKIDDLQLVSCESLNNPNELVKMDEFNGTIDSACSVDEFGYDCIKCKSVFDTDVCLKTMTCDEINKCYCQPGFYEKYCSFDCEEGFGFECAQKCGKCKDNERCHHINGHCLNGCEKYYVEPFCNETDLPYLKEAPRVHSPCSDYSCELIFNPDMYEGRKKPDSYNFQYQNTQWIRGGDQLNITSFPQILDITYNTNNTKYIVRFVLCVKDECMEGNEVPTLTFNTP
ncbi:PREDICTED: uncharacterized protein LOC108561207 isoform X2 [Nicrophorus vespilloides]|uniref:Uncharacterized protein LOC108561207 isoform X2 n=1 Tax=Nicrophorus vespilloides TaxID=110193 RepID=A0ABM1MIZ0_NICVS|nr:PREDICTED: uncharacterized protein LOC108561207 isoform X2 [Nicrophorus vespilloides]